MLPQLMFWLLIGLGLFCLGSAFVNWRHLIGPVPLASKSYVLIGMLAAGLMLVPMLTGGTIFTLFQGNYIDALRYLESAATYTKWPYGQIHGASQKQLLDAGLFPVAADVLHVRPTVAILYAVLSNFAPSLFLGLNYVMLVYFQFLSLGVLWLMARELVPERPLTTLLLCVLIVGGFWGQYILDINAWSQETFRTKPASIFSEPLSGNGAILIPVRLGLPVVINPFRNIDSDCNEPTIKPIITAMK
jgi:hypothetical protein